MATKKKLKTENIPIEEIRIDDVVISGVTLSKMSLNPYDQLFIKRLLDLHNNVLTNHIEMVYAGYIKGVYQSLAEILAANTTEIFKEFKQQNQLLQAIRDDIKIIKDDIKEMRDDIRLVNKRIDDVEKRVSALEARNIVLEGRLNTHLKNDIT